MKQRLDIYLVTHYPQFSRQKIQYLIKNNFVQVNKKKIVNVHYLVDDNDQIVFNLPQKIYVSRAAKKLLYAIQTFHLNLTNLVCLDIGSSTGGFCQVILEQNPQIIYAIDVGTNQMDKQISQNPKIVLYEKTNFLNVNKNSFSKQINFISCDVSFISLTKILCHIQEIFPQHLQMVCLIKPQFELTKEIMQKTNGVVNQPQYWKLAIAKITNLLDQMEWKYHPIVESPILGKDGNKEFLIYIEK